MADEKLNFDDISFDDVISEGLETTTTSEETVAEEVKEPKKETIDEQPEEVLEETKNELDADAEEEEEKKAAEPVNRSTETPKEETISEDAGEELPDTVVGEVLTKLGFEANEDYEDTADGLVKMAKDVGNILAQEQIEEMLNQFPIVKEHLQYAINGGDSRQFMSSFDPRQDYAGLKLSEKDTPMQKMLVTNYFRMKGHKDEFIRDLIEDYEDGGKLLGKAQLAHKELVQAQNLERQQMLQNQRQQAQMSRQEEAKFWDDVYGTITESKEFEGITIPEREKKKFFKYLTSPADREGNTKRDLDHANSSMETRLAIDYLMYKGFKLDDIIKSKVGTAKAKDLKARIKSHQDKVKSGKRSTRSKTAFDIDELDLSLGV